jgi:hypothetical protein
MRLQQTPLPRRMYVRGRLDLTDVAWLTYLPREMEVESLDVSRCVNLRGLPEQLTCLDLFARRTNIRCLAAGLRVSRIIVASNCSRLERIVSLSVSELRLRNCTALEELPEGLQVQHLNVSGCTQLSALPQSIASNIERLDVNGCFNLESLPEGCARLESLNVRGCTKLTALPKGIKIRSSIEVADSGLRSLPATLRSTRLFWRGALVSDRIAFEPETITIDEILREQNVERRRVLLERVGMEWFVANADAKVIDSDFDAGGQRRLLRISFQNGADVVCIEVRCPSTGRQYVLQVPPQSRACVEAAAWIAGFRDPARYRPLQET